MRKANLKDTNYIAKCLVDLSLYLKDQGSNIYIDNLPSQIDDFTLDIAKGMIEDKDSLTLIYEVENKTVGSISASIQNSSFPPSGIQKVVYVSMCWIDEDQRGKKIASKLLDEVENWAKQNGIKTLELSYLCENLVAIEAWGKMGFKPFRTFAYKNID
jgi:GNAT superfamily N-acetyltransferase